jgi:hypothetical protein
MTEGSDEKIVGLEVAMDDPEGVEVLHGKNGFRKIEPEI